MTCGRMSLILFLVLVICQHVMGIRGHGLHQAMENFDPDEEQDENNENELHKPEFVQDADHIREHLDESIKFDPETASPEEVEFYFFKIHDTDGDLHLDGLELLSALKHTVHKHMEKQIEKKQTEEEVSKVVQSYHKHLVNRIDRILKDEDTNGDGKLDYVEFAASRKARTALKQVGKKLNPGLNPHQ